MAKDNVRMCLYTFICVRECVLCMCVSVTVEEGHKSCRVSESVSHPLQSIIAIIPLMRFVLVQAGAVPQASHTHVVTQTHFPDDAFLIQTCLTVFKMICLYTCCYDLLMFDVWLARNLIYHFHRMWFGGPEGFFFPNVTNLQVELEMRHLVTCCQLVEWNFFYDRLWKYINTNTW